VKRLDLGTNPIRDGAVVDVVSKYSCFGGCSKTWAENDGGWLCFESDETGGAQLRPAWYCDECNGKRSDGGLKADTGN